MSALEARAITKVFSDGDTETKVLRGISTTITNGEFVALMGPSGCGKSTFLSIAGTLLSPTSGELLIAGHNAIGCNDRELSRLRNRSLGFVFQYHHLQADFTALENVLMPTYGDGRSPTRAHRARAVMLLERVGLKDRMQFLASRLSGGQKQRVAAARALIMAPALVLADEPTGNLDQTSSDELLRLLRQLSNDERTAFLLSTHDDAVAARCDRVLRMRDGALVTDGDV